MECRPDFPVDPPTSATPPGTPSAKSHLQQQLEVPRRVRQSSILMTRCCARLPIIKRVRSALPCEPKTDRRARLTISVTAPKSVAKRPHWVLVIFRIRLIRNHLGVMEERCSLVCVRYMARRNRPSCGVRCLPEVSLVGPLVAHSEGGANHVCGRPGWANVTSEPSRWQFGQGLPYVWLLKQPLLAVGPDGGREIGFKSAGRTRRSSVAGNGYLPGHLAVRVCPQPQGQPAGAGRRGCARFRAGEGRRPLLRLTRGANGLHHARNQHSRCRSTGSRPA